MNPLLKNVVDSVDQIASDPASKEQYDRIVLAGKKIMFDKATHDKISWLQNPEDLSVLVNGVFDLITIITELGGKDVQNDPLHGAAVVLTMEALDFAGRVNEIEITEEVAQAAVQAIDEKMSELNQGAASAPMQETQPMSEPEAPMPQGLIDSKGM
ncbi:hypothetical protein [Undibacterium sp.]|uniref:hypothetical protein n=1 Tax=Undibacterium sp. TaxID=1914977 RepID=UPI003752E38D